MADWHLTLWSIQYVVAVLPTLSITIYLYIKNKKILSYQIFFIFGVFLSTWLLFVFLHRIAPTEKLSEHFFRAGMFFCPLANPLIFLAILSLGKLKNWYVLIITPALLLSVIILFVDCVSVSWTYYGWTYEFEMWFMIMYSVFSIGYAGAIIIALIFLSRRTEQSLLRMKFWLFIVAIGAVYLGGMGITNWILKLNPSTPSFGGIITTAEFLLIAYAISLPTEKIDISPKMVEPLSRLSEYYLQFLNRLQACMPGKELGVSAIKFDEYVEAMGLSGVVYVNKCQKLVFDSGKFAKEDISEITDSVLRTLKEIPEAKEICQEFSNAFVETYKILKSKSKNGADKWFDRMMHIHGDFLSRRGILDAMPKEVKIPKIFKELIPGRMYLFKEEKPTKAYKKLKEALNYGFGSLCISKLHPEKVRERYDVDKASVFWLTFKKAEGTINPKDFVKLNRTTSEFVKRTDGSIVLLDCFDQIKFANGFQKSLTLLKDLRNLCNENNSTILISINTEMFKKQELAAIEKELEEVRTE